MSYIFPRPALTFDDVLLVPQRSAVKSRSTIDLSVILGTGVHSHLLKVPLIAANMDSVTEYVMAKAMADVGALGVIHRYMSPEAQATQVAEVKRHLLSTYPAMTSVAAAIGVKSDMEYRTRLLIESGCNLLFLDVAHGDHENVYAAMKKLRSMGFLDRADVVVGNIATGDAALALANEGAIALRVGVGSGSICSTRKVTGHGVPQLSAIGTCYEALAKEGLDHVKIIADGGVKESGDIVKALGMGATAIMSGSLFSGTTETPGSVLSYNGRIVKEYKGMASFEARNHFDGSKVVAPEGVRTLVDCKGSVKDVVARLAAGIRSGLSYSGCDHLTEFIGEGIFVQITPAGHIESQHALEIKGK